MLIFYCVVVNTPETFSEAVNSAITASKQNDSRPASTSLFKYEESARVSFSSLSHMPQRDVNSQLTSSSSSGLSVISSLTSSSSHDSESANTNGMISLFAQRVGRLRQKLEATYSSCGMTPPVDLNSPQNLIEASINILGSDLEEELKNCSSLSDKINYILSVGFGA